MKLYNSQTRQKEALVTVVPGEVRMYVCGPTVYNFIHVGNGRPLVVFDVLRRYLEYRGFAVKMVSNITDIDDKLIRRAAEEDTTVEALAQRYTKEYLQDAQTLGVLPPTYQPKATEHIGPIIALIKTLEKKGVAYAPGNGDVYFDTQAYAGYGSLSGQNLDDLEAGARIAVDDIKKHPMDFALWKGAKPGEPAWNSPWGMGRPGWHIECSAMAMKYLGESIDIHGGGQDLLFPHHENEKAQSEAATGKPFVRFWMHNAFLNVDNQKMSKSLNNFFALREIFAQYDSEVLRFFFLSAHYRSPLNFSREQMQQAQAALERLYTFRDNLRYLAANAAGENGGGVPAQIERLKESFNRAMDDDLNTADALSAIFEYVKALNQYFEQPRAGREAAQALEALMEICGVLNILGKKSEQVPADVQALAQQRAQARKDKNWAESDRLRDAIQVKGYLVEDTREGQKIRALI